MKKFQQCYFCNDITIFSNNDGNIVKKCRHCGSTKFIDWPGPEVIDLINHVEKLDPQDNHYSIISSVFLSIAFEILLEELISKAALWGRYYEEVDYFFELLLDSYRGRSRRLQLYSQVGDCSFEKDAQSTGNKNFPKHWDLIADFRNNSIHGAKNLEVILDIKLIKTTIDEGLDVFSKLISKYAFYEQKGLGMPKAPYYPIDFEEKKVIIKISDDKKLELWKETIEKSKIKVYKV